MDDFYDYCNQSVERIIFESRQKDCSIDWIKAGGLVEELEKRGVFIPIGKINPNQMFSGFQRTGEAFEQEYTRNNEFFLYATLKYKPTKLEWYFFSNPNLSPNTNYTQLNPIASDSFSIDNQKYYVYKNPFSFLYNTIFLRFCQQENTYRPQVRVVHTALCARKSNTQQC